MNHRPTHAILIAILVVLALGVLLIALPHATQKVTNEPQQAATTTPSVPHMTQGDWLTSTASANLTFRYPPQLSTTYMHATDWPPKVTLVADAPACTTREDEMGRTAARTIEGAQYCVTELSEGAAGSTYTTYTYVTQKEGKNVSLSFTLRAVQCGNYPEPEAGACQKERQNFSVDNLAKDIVDSIEFR